MQIGIFTKTFERATLAEKLDAIRAHGLASVQLNLDCAGLPPMPDSIDAATAHAIRDAHAERGIAISAVSGTFNIIHPDLQQRAAGMRRLRVLAAACADLGTSVITLSTGTCNPHNMWETHPDNGSPAAWEAMLASMHEIAAIGAEQRVTMAFEPEVSNVIDSALRARQLLDALASPWVKVVIDGANLFKRGDLARQRAVLDEAFALLGADIAMAHAKDLTRDGDAGNAAAGHGLLDYDHYLRLLHDSGFDGALILHGLSEAQAAGCVAFLRGKLPA
jgi:sugar phosphate isomerase/epimerase